MVHDHRYPLAIHDLEAADPFETLIAFLKGCKDFICIASAIPASLLVQKAGMLQEVTGPVDKRFPLGLLECDPFLVEDPLRWQEVLRDLLVVDFILSFDLNLRIKEFDDCRSTPLINCLRQLLYPLAC